MLKISKIRKSIANAATEYHVKQVLLFGSYANGIKHWRGKYAHGT